MRVTQTQRVAAGRAGGPSKTRPSQGGFSLSRGTETRKTATARGPATLSSIDAIVALQAVEDPTERRRKAVRQGEEVLDVLDDLKIALLSGQRIPAEKLAALKNIVARYSEDELPPDLAEVLRQIDLRARVELAKHGKNNP